jgi:hypothetical protein
VEYLSNHGSYSNCKLKLLGSNQGDEDLQWKIPPPEDDLKIGKVDKHISSPSYKKKVKMIFKTLVSIIGFI